MKEIAIGCDHAGIELKKIICDTLANRFIRFTNFGTNDSKSVDYPDFAKQVAEFVQQDPDNHIGILICGTGIGMSIVANRYSNIRAAVCYSVYTTEMSRKHNNANIMCIGSRTTTSEIAKSLIEIFLSTTFEGGRHQSRLDKID